jgi:hypothetical protein
MILSDALHFSAIAFCFCEVSAMSPTTGVFRDCFAAPLLTYRLILTPGRPPWGRSGGKQSRRRWSSAALFCCFLTSAIGTISPAIGQSMVAGVNVINPQRLSAAERTIVLDQLQAAGVQVIRAPLAPAWKDSDYGAAIDFIGGAFERGIKTDLIVELEYRQGAQRRPVVRDMPKMWPSFALSAADPGRFRGVFAPLFDQLEDLGVTLAALELGNEINWSAFNGDFPIPGEGRIFGGDDLARDPEARRIAKGFLAYLQTLQVLKDIRDHSQLNRATPIISAGLADPGPAGPRPGSQADAVAIGATLDFLRANGLDALVDAYGVHTYPWPKRSAAARLSQLERDTFAECRPSGEGKPCWLTEWGFPSESSDPCARDDASRGALIKEMTSDFRLFEQPGRLTGRLYYAWADAKYGIYRCGELSEGGQLAIESSTLR